MGCLIAHIDHDLLSPPLRPPRPKRTLGGTNLRADIVDVSLSTSASREEERGVLLLIAMLQVAAGDSDGFAASEGAS